MKKLLTVVLAAALVLGIGTTASASINEMGTLPNVTKIDAVFPDAKNETQTIKDDTAKMYALGVLEGLPNGNFAYDNTMTRAELAKVTTYLTNQVDSAKALATSASSYKDVKTAVWYTGWVNNVTTKGQMIGYPNGNFGPNDNVTIAELLTATLRSMGYNDNLAGNWPYDYVAQAAKLGLTANIDTNDVKRIATRRDLVQVLSGALEQTMVAWDKEYSRFVPYAASAYRLLTDADDYPFWSGWNNSATWIATNAVGVSKFAGDLPDYVLGMAPMDLLEYGFNGRVLFDVRFFNDYDIDDAVDAWAIDNFKDSELELRLFTNYNDEDDAEFEEITAASKYFISDNMTVFDLAGLTGDIILTDNTKGLGLDGEALYVDLSSSYSKTSDIKQSGKKDLEIDGKSVRIANSAWGETPEELYSFVDGISYAKVFYDEDGRVYDVDDLSWWVQDPQGILNELNTQDELLAMYDFTIPGVATLGDIDIDLEDANAIIIKDNAFVKAADLKSIDLITLPSSVDTSNIDWSWTTPGVPADDGSVIVIAETLNSGKLTEGDDDYLTIDSKDYMYGVANVDVGKEDVDFWSRYSSATGTDDYSDLTNIDDIDSALDKTVKFGTNRAGYQVSYLLHGEGLGYSKVYGVVTKMDVNTTTKRIDSLTILTQEDKKVTYDVDSDLRLYSINGLAEILSNSDAYVQYGSYIEVKVDSDNVITDLLNYDDNRDHATYGDYVFAKANAGKGLNNVDAMAYNEWTEFYNAVMPSLGNFVEWTEGDLAIDRNGKRIEINGIWYTIDSSTIIWNADFEDYYANFENDLTSPAFNSAEIIKNDLIKNATGIDCVGYVVGKVDGSVLKRLYVIDGDFHTKTGYDVVKKVSKKADGWNLKLLLADTTIYDDGLLFGNDSDNRIPTAQANETFIAYTTKDNEITRLSWPILNLADMATPNAPIGLDNHTYIGDGEGNYALKVGDPLYAENGAKDATWVNYEGYNANPTDADDIFDFVTPVFAKDNANGTVTLGNEEIPYYYDNDTVFIKVDEDGAMTKGSASDLRSFAIKPGESLVSTRLVMAITVDEEDTEDQLAYVFIINTNHDIYDAWTDWVTP